MFFKKKKNSEFENLLIQTEKKEKVKKEFVDTKWVTKIVVIAFCMSFTGAYGGYLLKLYIINFNSGQPPIRDVPVSYVKSYLGMDDNRATSV